MFNSMGSQNAWQPIQSRSEMADVITASPCRGCEHEHADKNYCIINPTCPLHNPTLRAPFTHKTKPEWTNICQFSGCAVKCAKTYCHKHDCLVRVREKRYPGRPVAFYRMPAQPVGGRSVSLDEMWAKHQEDK